MRPAGEKGLTLVELLVTMTIMGIIAMAAMPLLSISLEAHGTGTARSRLYQEGLMLMEKMTTSVRKTTFLQIPNNHTPTRNMLAVSNLVNDDNDFYFGDPLFPRVDEDYSARIMGSGQGILGIDDDGDGSIDNGVILDDDDEDGSFDEDTLDGIDNDGDGNIDEDVTGDANKDAFPGIEGIDDDDDGLVDEMSNLSKKNNDDEDDQTDEDFISFFLYSHDSATNTLREIVPSELNGVNIPLYSKVLSTRVTGFTTTYYPPDAMNHPRISISLTLTGDDGKSIQFVEYAYPRNILQKTGKRVR
jgi:prepilin-type N-terminal cleavage/methylation domain-containing protein